MIPVSVPTTATEVIKDAMSSVWNATVDQTQARMRLRHSITAYPDPLGDQVIIAKNKGMQMVKNMAPEMKLSVIKAQA